MKRTADMPAPRHLFSTDILPCRAFRRARPDELPHYLPGILSMAAGRQHITIAVMQLLLMRDRWRF